MMSELTRLIDEANRLMTVYEEHKNSENDWLRRKVHVDLDRFLMEHREVAILLMTQGLQDAFRDTQTKRPAPTRVRWYKRLLGGARLAKGSDTSY